MRDGDQVTAGETLLVLEAMKMEQAITAPRDGVVRGLVAEPGEVLSSGQRVAEIVES